MKVLSLLLFTATIFLFHPAIAQQPSVTVTSGISIGSSQLTGVAFGGGKYVTAGASGKVYSSTDGITWSPVTHAALPATAGFTDVEYGGGLFVISGSAGQLVTSPDGINWTARSSGVSTRINKLAYLNGKFFAVGNSGVFLGSDNGTTWSAINIGAASDQNLLNIGYGNSRYVVGVNSSSAGSQAFYSATAASGSWSLTTVLSGGSMNNLQFLKDRFWTMHSGTQILTSVNGATWTDASSTPLTYPNGTTATISTPNMFFHGLYDGTTIYFFGSSSYHTGSYGAVFTSTTGNAFTLQPKTNTLVPTNAAYVGGRYFATGGDGLISSANGSDWAYPGGSFNALATNGTSYIAAGNANQNDGHLFYSTDFSTWTNRTPSYVNALYGITWGNNKYVAVGNAGAVATSTNGTTWTVGVADATTDILRSVTYGAGKYVAVGTQGKITYSADGVSWTQAKRDAAAGNIFYGVFYYDGRFIAIGGSTALSSNVRIEYSSDGVNWTTVSPAFSGSLTGLAWNGTRYMLIGRDNTSGSQKFFSTTTTDITNAGSYTAPVTVPTASTGGIDVGSAGFGSVAYSGRRFVAMVNQKATPFDAYILESTTGTSWQAYPAGTTSRLRGLVASGDQFRSVGTGDTKVSAVFPTILPLKLENFIAVKRGKQTELEWRSSGELRTAYFDVERSGDGASYQSIGRITAAGQGNGAYTFTDRMQGNVSLINYRLKMVDRDGQFTYSPIRTVRWMVDETTLQVYPSPVINSFKLTLPAGAPSTISLQIYNNSGVLVKQQSHQAGAEVSMEGLPAGRYQVVVNINGQQLQAAFIKQ